MSINQRFQRAVALIGAGDVPALDRLLTEHPELAWERLAAPGPWLRDKIGGALDGFFKNRTWCGSWPTTCPSSAACRRTSRK
ncbi:MAG TPA: hypothetical protein VKE94_09815 [Gemmataceae bacterium]|nr:hypothetical protein [Gemmataceae bacterium]